MAENNNNEERVTCTSGYKSAALLMEENNNNDERVTCISGYKSVV